MKNNKTNQENNKKAKSVQEAEKNKIEDIKFDENRLYAADECYGVNEKEFVIKYCRNALKKEHPCVCVWCPGCEYDLLKNAKKDEKNKLKGGCDHRVSELLIEDNKSWFKLRARISHKKWCEKEGVEFRMPLKCSGCGKWIVCERKLLKKESS